MKMVEQTSPSERYASLRTPSTPQTCMDSRARIHTSQDKGRACGQQSSVLGGLSKPQSPG